MMTRIKRVRKEEKMKVLNFGSLNLDYVYQVDHILAPGETQTAGERTIFCGGKGLNQSIALARAGAEVYHAGLVGDGGEPLIDILKRNNVNTKYTRQIEGPGGHTVIQVDKNGQNSILLFAGSNRKITREFVDEVMDGFQEGDYLVLQNEISELSYIIDRAFEKKLRIVLNPSPFDDHLKDCDLSKVSLFLINEVEGYQISGEQEPEKILDAMYGRCPGAGVVLTLGAAGSIYMEKGERIHQDIFKVKAVDTTGAGDTFTGYFLAGLLEGMEKKDALILAAKASAIGVTRNGAAASVPSREEVDTWNPGQ